MKCSVVGCPNTAFFHDRVPEAAKKMGIKAAAFCHEHQNSQNKLGKLHELLAKRKSKPIFEGENDVH